MSDNLQDSNAPQGKVWLAVALVFIVLSLLFAFLWQQASSEASRLMREKKSFAMPPPQDDSALRAEIESLRKELDQARSLADEKEAKLAELGDKVSRAMESSVSSAPVTVHPQTEEVSIKFTSELFFDSGSDILTDRGAQALDKIADLLQEDASLTLAIEGHTDSVPIGSRIRDFFPSNWHLSASRSIAALEYLNKVRGIPIEKLSATGFGPSRPIGENSTEAGRKKNRRVEIKIKSS